MVFLVCDVVLVSFSIVVHFSILRLLFVPTACPGMIFLVYDVALAGFSAVLHFSVFTLLFVGQHCLLNVIICQSFVNATSIILQLVSQL